MYKVLLTLQGIENFISFAPFFFYVSFFGRWGENLPVFSLLNNNVSESKIQNIFATPNRRENAECMRCNASHLHSAF